jgi:peptidoglycan/LPS O-acetylase OafA/YrhL
MLRNPVGTATAPSPSIHRESPLTPNPSPLKQARGEEDKGPSWLAGGRIPSLDGLRALAILLVIFAHSRFPGDHLLPLRTLRGRAGFLGVQVFFVLSGFLITTLMLREVRRTGKLHLGHFYLRRALRIVPVYACYLLLLALIQSIGYTALTGKWWLAAATWTVNLVPGPMPPPICHFWSLCVEEHFYLLWPLLMALLTPRMCRWAIPAGLASVLALRCGLLLAWPGATVDLLTFTRIDDIAVGCGLAFLSHDPLWRARLDRFVSSGRCLAVLIVGFLASQVFCSNLVGSMILPRVPLQLAIGVSNDVNTATIACLMWFVLTRPAGFFGKLLNHPIAVGIGVISYSAYLWHLPVCELGPSWLGAFPQNIIVIFSAAFLSYRLIEKPFLSLKDRLGAPARRMM